MLEHMGRVGTRMGAWSFPLSRPHPARWCLNRVSWETARAKGRAADPRPPDEQALGKALAKERQEEYDRGHQLAEMRKAAEIT